MVTIGFLLVPYLAYYLIVTRYTAALNAKEGVPAALLIPMTYLRYSERPGMPIVGRALGAVYAPVIALDRLTGMRVETEPLCGY